MHSNTVFFYFYYCVSLTYYCNKNYCNTLLLSYIYANATSIYYEYNLLGSGPGNVMPTLKFIKIEYPLIFSKFIFLRLTLCVCVCVWRYRPCVSRLKSNSKFRSWFIIEGHSTGFPQFAIHSPVHFNYLAFFTPQFFSRLRLP